MIAALIDNHRLSFSIMGSASLFISLLALVIYKIFDVKFGSRTDKFLENTICIFMTSFFICYVILASSIIIEGVIKFIS